MKESRAASDRGLGALVLLLELQSKTNLTKLGSCEISSCALSLLYFRAKVALKFPGSVMSSVLLNVRCLAGDPMCEGS